MTYNLSLYRVISRVFANYKINTEFGTKGILNAIECISDITNVPIAN